MGVYYHLQSHNRRLRTLLAALCILDYRLESVLGFACRELTLESFDYMQDDLLLFFKIYSKAQSLSENMMCRFVLFLSFYLSSLWSMHYWGYSFRLTISLIYRFSTPFQFWALADNLMNDCDLSPWSFLRDLEREMPLRLAVDAEVEIGYRSAWIFHLLKIWDLSVKLIGYLTYNYTKIQPIVITPLQAIYCYRVTLVKMC